MNFESAIEWILALQEAGGEFGATFFKTVTFLGDQEFYLLLFPLLFWCIDTKLGIRVAVAYLLSTILNVALKDLIGQPRPFEINPAVGLIDEYGRGMPSNHAQATSIIFGILAYHLKKPWGWGVAVLITLLVGFSRIYLGVHFPAQVLVGWALAIALLVIYISFLDQVEAWLAQRSFVQHVAMATILAALILIGLGANGDIVAATAVLWAMWCGVALLRALDITFYNTDGTVLQRVGRFILGAVVVFIIFGGLRAIFPDEGEPFYAVMRFVRYGLVGLFVSLGGPWLFTKVGLSSNRTLAAAD
ncbi:MAG: phosphatase PAP2 family protein [Chloroflexota bacterium]